MTEQLVPFGRYLLEKRIAIGGMAEIFLAYLAGPAQFRKRVVIKRLHSHLRDNEAYVRMFLDEARIMAALAHPNLVHVHELAEIDGRYCLVMEYLEGDHVRHLVKAVIKRGLKMPPQIAAYIISKAAQAADYVHGFQSDDGQPLKIVHRDMSPMNIVVSWRGEVKVVDFGIAKYEGSEETKAGVVKGTASYMSPEQARGERVDSRSDIYSLGVVLYEMIALRRLYGGSGSTLEEALRLMRYIAHLKELPETILRSRMPESIRGVLKRALQPERDRRYLTAGEMARDLEAYLTETSRPLGSDLGDYARDIIEPENVEAPVLDKGQILVDGLLADPAKTIATHDLSQIMPGYDPSDPTRVMINPNDTSSSMEFPAAEVSDHELTSDWTLETEESDIIDTPLFDPDRTAEEVTAEEEMGPAQWAPETKEDVPALPETRARADTDSDLSTTGINIDEPTQPIQALVAEATPTFPARDDANDTRSVLVSPPEERPLTAHQAVAEVVAAIDPIVMVQGAPGTAPADRTLEPDDVAPPTKPMWTAETDVAMAVESDDGGRRGTLKVPEEAASPARTLMIVISGVLILGMVGLVAWKLGRSGASGLPAVVESANAALTIHTVPPGASVFIANMGPAAPSPRSVQVVAGTYEVKVEAPDTQPFEFRVEVLGADDKHVTASVAERRLVFGKPSVEPQAPPEQEPVEQPAASPTSKITKKKRRQR